MWYLLEFNWILADHDYSNSMEIYQMVSLIYCEESQIRSEKTRDTSVREWKQSYMEQWIFKLKSSAKCSQKDDKELET